MQLYLPALLLYLAIGRNTLRGAGDKVCTPNISLNLYQQFQLVNIKQRAEGEDREGRVGHDLPSAEMRLSELLGDRHSFFAGDCSKFAAL
jgi:hypothetical protein